MVMYMPCMLEACCIHPLLSTKSSLRANKNYMSVLFIISNRLQINIKCLNPMNSFHILHVNIVQFIQTTQYSRSYIADYRPVRPTLRVCKWLHILVFSDKDRPRLLHLQCYMVIAGDVKDTTHPLQRVGNVVPGVVV